MKWLAALAALVAALFSAGSATALPPGPARLDLQTSIVETKQLTPNSRSVVFALYNKPAYKTRLGTAVAIITSAGRQWRAIKAYIHLTRGTLVTDALVPAASNFYTLAVLGGTGYYANVTGTVTFQAITPKAGVLLATLQGF